ncbi:MAG: M23 family metallopeptidase [Fimbriimonadaceae bacterium]|nr:M23 family metallopeptidase [Fimbriimonadaceae bacterium]
MVVLATMAFAYQVSQLPANPWKGMAPPPAGHERWEGRVVTYESAKRLLVMDVDSTWNDRGDEHFFGRADRRELILPRSVLLRWTDRGRRAVSGSDLVGGREIAVIYRRIESEVGDATEIMLYSPGSPVPSRSGVRTPVARPGALGAIIDSDGVSSETVTLPIIYPVLGGTRLADTFLASRGGGTRRHHGQDLMAPKLTPLVAAFDGTVSLRSSPRHYWLTISAEDGWQAVYMHINNDSPGTDNAMGGERFAFAPGIKDGSTVRAGEMVGWVGDSGNAEGTGPHLHFELHTPEGHVVNSVFSLEAANQLTVPVPRQATTKFVRKSGQTRLDGVVHKYDKERDVLVVVMATLESDSGAGASLLPDLKYIKGAAKALGRAEFPVGAWVVTVGTDLGKGEAFEAASLEIVGS